MRKTLVLAVLFLVPGLAAPCAPPPAPQNPAPDTETVICTMRVKPGAEDEFAKVIAVHWPTLRRLKLVEEKPHLVLRGKDQSGKTYYVEILTWVDHEAPEHVPPEVQAVWDRMQPLVEARDGHRGIEFPEVEVVGPN